MGKLNKRIKMEEKNMSEKESIELISRMIEESKIENDDMPGNNLIWWGCSSVVTCIVIFLVMWLFNGRIPIWVTYTIGTCGFLVPFIRERIRVHRHKAVTHTDHAINCMWETLTIAFAAYGTYFFVQQMLNYSISALASMYLVMILFSTIATQFTLAVYKIRTVAVYLLGIPTYMFYSIKYTDAFMEYLACPEAELLLALVLGVSLILPGKYLNNKAMYGELGV